MRGPRARIVVPLAALLLALSAAAVGAASLEVRPEAALVGTYGLEVALGPTCASPDDVALGPPDGPLAGTYEACRTVTAADVQVDPAGAVLRAGESIALGNDFSVDQGSELTAEIETSLSGGDRYVENTSPIAEDVYNASFSLFLDSLVLGSGQALEHLTGYSGLGAEEFKITIQGTGSGFELVLESRHGGGTTQTPSGQEIQLAAGWNQIEVAWRAGTSDGQLLVDVNGAGLQGLTSLDNSASLVETIRWGAISGDVETASGVLRLDAFSSWR